MKSWQFWAAFGVGVATGAAIALILAPQTGARTRRQIRRGWEDASDYLRERAGTVGEQAGKYVQRGKDAWEDVSDQAQSVVSNAKKVLTFA